jgi:dihydroneopterin aldolase
VTDSIVLSALELYARHGALEHEMSHAHPFVIDVVPSADLSEAGASDRLGATIDYGEPAGRIHDLVASRRWQPIERVYPRWSQVEVTLHKPMAPIGLPFDVAVTIQRFR